MLCKPPGVGGSSESPTRLESKSPSVLIPGHIVNVDLIPFTEMCIGGIQHHLLCCDELSTHLQSFPMKTKSNNHIILAFTLMIAFYKQHGYTIQIIHSDHEITILSAQVFLNQ